MLNYQRVWMKNGDSMYGYFMDEMLSGELMRSFNDSLEGKIPTLLAISFG